MKQMIRSSSLGISVAVTMAFVATLSCGGTVGDSTGGTDSNTHFLDECESDADCGTLSCECGVCTTSCSMDSDCGGLSSSATCADACSGQSLCVDIASDVSSSSSGAVAGSAGTGHPSVAGTGGSVGGTGGSIAGIGGAVSVPAAGGTTAAEPAACEPDPSACAGTTIEREVLPDGGSVELDCRFRPPGPPEGETHGPVVVAITPVDGELTFLDFVNGPDDCDVPGGGWYYEEAVDGMYDVVLCPDGCDMPKDRIELWLACGSSSLVEQCPFAGPPPGCSEYQPGMSQPLGGGLSVSLVNAIPAPPAVGTNTWDLLVRDSDGATITTANVSAEPFMPDHGHGSPVQPAVTQSGDVYRVEGLELIMAGKWDIAITVETDTTSVTAPLTFCVE